MKSSSKLKILSIFVIISTCIQYSLSQDYPGLDDYPGDYSEEPLACAEPDYSGDGICDDQNNNADCDFDGGDCCGPHVDKTFCIKCECLEDDQEPDENFLDFFRSLSHVPQYHPEPTTKPPSQNFLAQQFHLQQGITYPPSTNHTPITLPPHNPCNTRPPCNGHGYCSPFGTVCDCKHEYSGVGCEIPPGGGTGGGPCQLECNGQLCNKDNTACDCQNGSSEPDCSTPGPNACTTNPPCSGHGHCSLGGTVCHCIHGHTGERCEIPPCKLECNGQPCNSDNTACDCQNGSSQPDCSTSGPNSCTTNPPCSGHGYCSLGGTVCHCIHGHTGDGCEIPPCKLECNGQPCNGDNTACDCQNGSSQPDCSTPGPNPCNTNPPCNGHGYCSSFGAGCDCKHGYTGAGCQIPPGGGGGGGPCNLECNGQPCNSDNTACDCQNGSSEPDCSDFDPHGNKTHCVDVSTYSYPVWVKEPRKCCSTEFVKKEHKRWEEVCMNVTSLYCDVWPSTECEMKMSNVTLNTTTWQYVYFPKITCVPTYKKVVHMKKKPYCIKKPKYHCTSKWKMLPSGEKVWDGYDNCTVIYWDDCKLVDYNETIKVETPQCNVTHKIPYMTIVKKPTIEMVYKMECEVIKKTHCKAKTDESCKTIDYTETKEEPVKNCEHTYIKKPTQEPEHKTKCLFMKNDYLQKTHLTNGLLGGSLF